jgi:serine/threonine protein kinase
MEALYKKVCKGKYPQIPNHFSFELKRVLSLMVQIKPQRRPTTQELLNLKEVKDKIDEFYLDDTKSDYSSLTQNDLLSTIEMPEEFK